LEEEITRALTAEGAVALSTVPLCEPNVNPDTSATPKPRIPDLDLETVLRMCEPVLHAGRSMAQADIYPLTYENQSAVLKTFHARPAWVRRVWAERVAAREVRMLTRLLGMRDVPQLLATCGRAAFVMTRLEARRLPARKESPPHPEFWNRARTLIEEMHTRGIAHGDLRRKNLLMNEAATEPFLIDFATAVSRPGAGAPHNFSNALKHFLYKRCRRIDRITFVRIKAAYKAPLSPEEQAWLDAEPWYLKLGRFWKHYIYRLRKPSFWRNWRYRRQKARATRLGTPRPKKRRKVAVHRKGKS
jgi:predicted Ser/Thr protein kinase